MTATTAQRRDLAAAIAQQATALAEGTVTGPEHGAVARLVANVETLAAWTPDDRDTRPEHPAAPADRPTVTAEATGSQYALADDGTTVLVRPWTLDPREQDGEPWGEVDRAALDADTLAVVDRAAAMLRRGY